MKKILMAATVALCVAGNAIAQENAGGDNASNSALGDMNKEKIVAGVVGAGVLAALVMNNRGNTKAAPIDPTCGIGETLVDGVCVTDPDPVCAGEDPLVDGVCTGTTTTLTVTASGTGTATITVPLTYTYLPTI